MPAQTPNILFITTDMHRHDALHCAGNSVIQTPNLDALAATGVRFRSAYVNNPVCMPSRSSLFTGKLPSAHGVRWNAAGLAAHEQIITRRLQQAGYQTALIGKWHRGQTQADYGLEYYNIVDGQGFTSPGLRTYHEALHEAGLDSLPDIHTLPDYKTFYGAAASPLPPEYHLDGFIARETVRFLENRDTSRPFYCWCSFYGPHLPLNPSKPWDVLYDSADIPLPEWPENELDSKPPEQRAFQQNTERGNGFGDYRYVTRDAGRLRRFIAHYWGMISMIDSFIGQIVASLEATHGRENTVIIFTSDHGDFVGHHDLLFKQAFLYDDLVRVPLIFSWPGHWQPAVRDAFVEEIDLPLTMLWLADLLPYAGMQGESLIPLLTGESDSVRDAVYAEAVDQRMIRTEEWKLVHYAGKPYGELYDLRTDPGEFRNLYDDPAYLAMREALAHSLLDRMIANEARLHPPVPYLGLNDPNDPTRKVYLPHI